MAFDNVIDAYASLMQFAQQRGRLTLRLALYAAVPQGFTADLLYLLAVNFVPELNTSEGHVSVADVIRSALCQDLGSGYYEFDPQIRTMLLNELARLNRSEQEGASPVEKIANFLLGYVNHAQHMERTVESNTWWEYLEVQRWTALAFLNPDSAAKQIAKALQASAELSDASIKARLTIQIGALASSLAQPLFRHEELLRYIKGRELLEQGQVDRGRELLERFGDRSIEVEGIVLSPASALADYRLSSESELGDTTTDSQDNNKDHLSVLDETVTLPSSIQFQDMYPKLNEAEIETNWRASIQPEHAEWLRASIGVGADGNIQNLTFVSGSTTGLVIAGAAGAGKSELVESLLLDLAIRYSPTIFNFIIVNTYSEIYKLPHCVRWHRDSSTQVESILDYLVEEITRRARLLGEAPVRDIVDYHQEGLHRQNNDCPFLLFVIEELYVLRGNSEVLSKLENISRLGRSMGITLVITTQAPATVLTDQMLAYFNTRLCFHVRSVEDSYRVLGRSDAAFLPSSVPGRGYLQIGLSKPELIQTAYSGLERRNLISWMQNLVVQKPELGTQNNTVIRETPSIQPITQTSLRAETDALIYISYAHQDRPVIETILKTLAELGFNIRSDESLLPGQNWQQEVEKYITDCEIFVLCLTQAFINSNRMKAEVDTALRQQKRIIAVLLEDVSIPDYIADIQTADLRPDKGNQNREWQHLIEALNSEAGPNSIQEDEKYILLAFASDDGIPFAEQVYKVLVRRGIPVRSLLNEATLNADVWREKVIPNASGLVIVISPGSTLSRSITVELPIALENRLPVIPLIFEAADIPEVLKPFKAIQIGKSGSLEDHIKEIITSALRALTLPSKIPATVRKGVPAFPETLSQALERLGWNDLPYRTVREERFTVQNRSLVIDYVLYARDRILAVVDTKSRLEGHDERVKNMAVLVGAKFGYAINSDLTTEIDLTKLDNIQIQSIGDLPTPSQLELRLEQQKVEETREANQANRNTYSNNTLSVEYEIFT